MVTSDATASPFTVCTLTEQAMSTVHLVSSQSSPVSVKAESGSAAISFGLTVNDGTANELPFSLVAPASTSRATAVSVGSASAPVS